jgi:hypothetical protein
MSDRTLLQILGKDLAPVVESFNAPLLLDGEYMVFRSCTIRVITLMDIISKHFNQGCSEVNLYMWQFDAINPIWYPRLATDLEMLGYSITFDVPQDGWTRTSFIMGVKWAMKALSNARSVNYTQWQKNNPQFSDEEGSDDESEDEM